MVKQAFLYFLCLVYICLNGCAAAVANNVQLHESINHADHDISLAKKIHKSSSDKQISKPVGTPNRVFPEKSVQVWEVNNRTLLILQEAVRKWVIFAKQMGQTGVFPESVRINEMFLDSIGEYLEAKKGECELEINQHSLFLVAVVNETIHGVALLNGSPKNYTRKIEYLTVAPANLDRGSSQDSFSYVGSSIVEKSLELSDTITLEPANESSAAAYQKMGFITLKVDEAKKDDLGVGILFGNAADKLKLKLHQLRSGIRS